MNEGEDSCYRLTINVPFVSLRTQNGIPNPTAYTTGLLRHFRRCVLYTTHKRNVELTLIFQSLWYKLVGTKYLYTVYRAPQCISPRRNWDSPNSPPASECALPTLPKVGGSHSPAAKGERESQFRRLEKSLALCLLCAGGMLCLLSYRYVVHSTVRVKLLLTSLYAFKWNRKVTSGRNELKRTSVQHLRKHFP